MLNEVLYVDSKLMLEATLLGTVHVLTMNIENSMEEKNLTRFKFINYQITINFRSIFKNY